jgi:hypothetical protein
MNYPGWQPANFGRKKKKPKTWLFSLDEKAGKG